MDQGLIRSLKAHYRRKIVRLCIKALNGNKPQPRITILQVLKNLLSSWNAVSEETIAYCFKKANISHVNQQTAVTDADNPLKSLEEQLDNLRKLDRSFIQDNLSPDSYMNDADILTEVISDSIEDQDDDDVTEDLDFSPPLKRPSKHGTIIRTGTTCKKIPL